MPYLTGEHLEEFKKLSVEEEEAKLHDELMETRRKQVLVTNKGAGARRPSISPAMMLSSPTRRASIVALEEQNKKEEVQAPAPSDAEVEAKRRRKRQKRRGRPT